MDPAAPEMGNGLCVVLFSHCCGAGLPWLWPHLIRPIS